MNNQAFKLCLQIAENAMQMAKTIKQQPSVTSAQIKQLKFMSEQVSHATKYSKQLLETFSADVGSVSMPLGGVQRRSNKKKKDESLDEGIVDNIRAMNYDRLAKRSDRKASAALDKAMELDFTDDERFGYEDQMMKYAKQRDDRARKAGDLRNTGKFVVDDDYINWLASSIPPEVTELADDRSIIEYARKLISKQWSDVHARSFWVDEEVDDISNNARKLLAKVYRMDPQDIGYHGSDVNEQMTGSGANSNTNPTKHVADKLRKSGNTSLASKIQRPGAGTQFNKAELDAVMAAKNSP